mmetsp:Transcript_8750/g.20948  ORF Transcript_8750/g.20948 Transcript_8750/m.20948 type:complete len:493 (+) Transcript_8750:87-1565(+)
MTKMSSKWVTVPLVVMAVAMSFLSLWESSHCTPKNFEGTHATNVPPHINEQNNLNRLTSPTKRKNDERALETAVPGVNQPIIIPAESPLLLPTEVPIPIPIPETCSGAPKERRALARNDKATSEDWKRMTQCTLDRYSTLYGHFSMHISKAGGTSFCEALKDKTNKCRQLPPKKESKGTNYNYNCYVAQNKPIADGPMWKRQKFYLGPRWTRKETKQKLKLDFWMGGDEEDNIISCSVIENHLETEDNMVVFSENHLVSGDACDNKMVNSIVIREPMKRLLSHYNDVYLWCLKYKNNPLCLKMLQGGNLTDGARIYDTMFMAENFDFISDNIYARSLNPSQTYYAPLGFEGMDSEAVLSSALESLSKFDWVVVIGSGNSAEGENNDLILKDGLGLGLGLPHSNTVGSKASASKTTKTPSSLSAQGKIFLRKLNDLDYRIWEEAQALHSLDVKSINLMKQHGADIFAEYETKKRKNASDICCGYVCKAPNSQK